MKKILSGFIFIVSMAAFNAQAVVVETDVITITGFDAQDAMVAQSNSLGTEVLAINNGVPTETEVAAAQTDVMFKHNYDFDAVGQTMVQLSTTNSNINNPSNVIVDLTMSLYEFIGGVYSLVASAVVPADGANTSLPFAMTASNDYRISITGDGTNAGLLQNYTLTVSSVPVPAAVWLFGSALLGIFGLRRKGKMDAVAA